MTRSALRVIPEGSALCARLAPWVPIAQDFPHRALEDPEKVLHDSLIRRRDELGLTAGTTVAVAVGSRGVAGIQGLVRTVIHCLREVGAQPFIVPAMGSHGGGTAEGQIAMLHSLGVSGETVGAPIRSSMDTVRIGEVGGVDVHVDRIAATEADLIIPIARVKPHTDFRGPIESGVLKMLSIGLGKHRGADSLHRVPPTELSSTIEAAGALVIREVNIAGAVAIVEDAYDRVGHVEVLTAGEITDREPDLLQLAASWMPSLPFDDVDVLIVEEMGKNISGPGMDPNITGRFYVPRPGSRPNVGVLVVLSLTEASHGNATGVGMADIVTARLADDIDWPATYTNEVASRMLAGPKLPLVACDDEDALATAVHCLGLIPPERARIAWIRNTLSLSQLHVSLPLWEELSGKPGLRRLAACQRVEFVAGKLKPPALVGV